MGLSRADRQLLADAQRDLEQAPRTLSNGSFTAKYNSTCQRCRRVVRIGQDVRYHPDYTKPVHDGCRKPAPRSTAPKRPKPQPETICGRCSMVHGVAQTECW